MKKEYTYEIGDVVTMKKPHPCGSKELDGANHLHTSSAADLSEAILKLKSDCHLKIFGGCCGTDSSHMEKIAKISEVT